MTGKVGSRIIRFPQFNSEGIGIKEVIARFIIKGPRSCQAGIFAIKTGNVSVLSDVRSIDDNVIKGTGVAFDFIDVDLTCQCVTDGSIWENGPFRKGVLVMETITGSGVGGTSDGSAYIKSHRSIGSSIIGEGSLTTKDGIGRLGGSYVGRRIGIGSSSVTGSHLVVTILHVRTRRSKGKGGRIFLAGTFLTIAVVGLAKGQGCRGCRRSGCDRFIRRFEGGQGGWFRVVLQLTSHVNVMMIHAVSTQRRLIAFDAIFERSTLIQNAHVHDVVDVVVVVAVVVWITLNESIAQCRRRQGTVLSFLKTSFPKGRTTTSTTIIVDVVVIIHHHGTQQRGGTLFRGHLLLFLMLLVLFLLLMALAITKKVVVVSANGGSGHRQGSFRKESSKGDSETHG
mmetsp:Transcript_11091/g.19926  ORF Transcript_11091/g.19926 Transcript_11091/m.19926 type:complete len:396 (-) Transcript_11091:136-1323(-)